MQSILNLGCSALDILDQHVKDSSQDVEMTGRQYMEMSSPLDARLFALLMHLWDGLYVQDESTGKRTLNKLVFENMVVLGAALLSNVESTLLEESVSRLEPSRATKSMIITCEPTITIPITLPSDDVEFVIQLLSELYQERFKEEKSLQDLHFSIALRLEAVHRLPKGKLRYQEEHNLCKMLIDKYEITKDLEDVTEAIAHGRASLMESTPGKDSPEFFWSLSEALFYRAEHHTMTTDFRNAVVALRAAIVNARRGQNFDYMLFRSQFLLAYTAGTKSSERIALIRFLREMIASTPEDNPHHGYFNCTLAVLLSHTSSFSGGDESDGNYLEEAIQILKNLLEKDAKAGVDKSGLLEVLLFHCLQTRYKRLKSEKDLQDTLSLATYVHDTSTKPLCRSWASQTLVVLYHHQYAASKNLDDLNRCLMYCQEIKTPQYQPSESKRFSILTLAGMLEYERGRYENSLRDFREAIDLLPRILSLGTDRPPKWDAQVSMAAAAAAANNQARIAVEYLELGRSIGWTRSLHMRSSFEILEVEHPEHARRLKVLSNLSNSAELAAMRPAYDVPNTQQNTITFSEGADELSSIASRRWDTLVAEIRRLDGYGDFFAPPQYDQLKAAAAEGPAVVVNISELRSDAFIISNSTHDRPQIVSFGSDLYESVHRWSDELLSNVHLVEDPKQEPHFGSHILRPLLKELWTEVVRPIRVALNALAPYARRIWWCPTGQLTFLPLHLVTNGLDDTESDFLQLIPSYAITLSSLLRAKSIAKSTDAARILGVCCERPQDSKQTTIRGTKREVKELSKIFGSRNFKLLQNAEACREQVRADMARYSWLHLACHGVQSSDNPYASYFALSDGSLTMSDIISLIIANPEFAFLSACQTASGVAALSDEAMHLAAGLHFMGFRGTIATMWSVHDGTARQVAKEVYSFLLRDPESMKVEDASEALWRATRLLRSRVPLSRLAPFIHIGA